MSLKNKTRNLLYSIILLPVLFMGVSNSYAGSDITKEQHKSNRIRYANLVERYADEEERTYFVPGLLTNNNHKLDKEGEFYTAAENYNTNPLFGRLTEKLFEQGDISEEAYKKIRDIAEKLRKGQYKDPITEYYDELHRKMRRTMSLK